MKISGVQNAEEPFRDVMRAFENGKTAFRRPESKTYKTSAILVFKIGREVKFASQNRSLQPKKRGEQRCGSRQTGKPGISLDWRGGLW